jgi:pyruvate-formate lyase-activating enzyme
MMQSNARPAGHYGYVARSIFSSALWRRCPPFPSRIHLQTQTRCNAHCAICPHPRLSTGWQHGAMEWSLFDSITRQIAVESTAPTVVVELHNEPLLNPDIFSWIRHIKTTSPAARCVLITNGALLNQFEPGAIAASGVDTLAVSLNAYSRDTYDKLNCGLDYDLVVENITRLAEVPEIMPRLRVDFVETETNHKELALARDFWNKQGVRTLCKPLHNRAGTLDNYDELVARQEKGPHPVRGFRHLMNRHVGCVLPFYQMSVLHNGDAILCCHDWEHACVVGTAAGQSLREIWNGPVLQRIRHSLLTGRVDSIVPCRDCTVARR